MANTKFSTNRTLDPANPAWVRLVDLGDGTHALASYECVTDSYHNIAGAATTVVKSGAGVLSGIVFNKSVASSVTTIYDNTAASGTKIGTITMPAILLSNQLSLAYGCAFATGLTIVTSAADDITVIYS